MSVLILSCPCGLRMKAKGATPGRVGRCPQCGQTLTVPEAAEVETKAKSKPRPQAEPLARGYDLPSSFHSNVTEPDERRQPRKGAKRRTVEPAPMPEVAREVEPWWRPDVLFPMRGAEGLMVVAMMGLACWIVATLMPELCLQFIADGGFLMGLLISIVAALPALALGFFAVTYILQYLGRVLVSGSMGEVKPPRPPDRNFDGLANGLAPWLIWMACGATVGLGPLAAYVLWRGWDDASNVVVVLLLAVVGLPYALMSLLMTFLHDSGIPRPNGVVAALVRFHVGFLAVCAIEFGLASVVVGTFIGMTMLREVQFWVFLPLMLPCWMLTLWSGIVAMRILGVFYYHHASILRWHREKPWWGVSWGI